MHGGSAGLETERTACPELRHDRRRADGRDRGDQIGWVRRRIGVDDDRQLVWAAKDDVDAGGKLAEDRCRLDVRPQSATQIDVEADLQPRAARQVARPEDGRGRSR